MALRKSDIPLQRHTLNLFEGEFDRLKELYGEHVDASKVIRELVHRHLVEVERRLEEQVPKLDLELPE